MTMVVCFLCLFYLLYLFLKHPHLVFLSWQCTPVLLPGKSHGRRSLVGCSPWGRWVGHDWATSLSLFTFMHWRRRWQLTPVFLPGESQGWQSLVGCRLWGRTKSDTTEASQQQQHISYIYIYVCISPAFQCLSIRIYKIQGLHWVLTSRFIELILCVKMRKPRADAGFPSLFVTLFNLSPGFESVKWFCFLIYYSNRAYLWIRMIRTLVNLQVIWH